MIFQALGARYSAGAALKHIWSTGRASDSEALTRTLGERYKGEAVLYRKGRAALTEAVRLGTGGKGKVAVSGLTCYSLVQAVQAAGCEPVYVDIRESDLHFDGVTLRRTLQSHPDISALIIQNMLGIPADIVEIKKIASEHNIVIIEDLAHSAGARYSDGAEVGTVGQLTILSFGRDKAIDSVNGGALIVRNGDAVPTAPTNDVSFLNQLRDRLYPFIAWKSRQLYRVGLGRYSMALAIKLGVVVRSADGEVDTNERLPHWQARIALSQLRQLDEIAASRRARAKEYAAKVRSFIPEGVLQEGAAPIRLPLLVDTRDALVAQLQQQGIQVNDIWYDTPVSPLRFYGAVNYPEQDCPVAVQVASRLINLPTHAHITGEDIDKITSNINKAGV